ncbi:MAG: hypothetical protein RR363_03625 [Rikenellaceae bacterium]
MINDILISYFKEKGSVIIPKKGIIIKVNDNNSTTAFVYNPTVDYSEIREYTKVALEIDDNAANTIIDGFCALMDSKLNNNGEYTIEGIGTLRTDGKWGVYMVDHNDNKPTKAEPHNSTDETPISHTRRFDEAISEKATEKRLDTVLAEPHHLKVDVTAPVTFADKYRKHQDEENNVSEDIHIEAEKTTCECQTDETKDIARHDKLNEIFAARKGQQESSVELSDKLNELYKNKQEEQHEPEELNQKSETAYQPSVAQSFEGRKKGVDKVMVFFIISIILFLSVLAYYFIVVNEVELTPPDGINPETEQVEITE